MASFLKAESKPLEVTILGTVGNNCFSHCQGGVYYAEITGVYCGEQSTKATMYLHRTAYGVAHYSEQSVFYVENRNDQFDENMGCFTFQSTFHTPQREAVEYFQRRYNFSISRDETKTTIIHYDTFEKWNEVWAPAQQRLGGRP